MAACCKRSGGDVAGAKFGTAVALVGDIDKDTFPDFLVGAPIPGEVFLFSGKNGSLIDRVLAPIANYKFGWAVAGIGDVNHDTVPDFVVGAPEEGQATQGAVHVFCGRTRTLLKTLKRTNEGDQFGWSVAGIGDVNSDTVPDFVIAAPYNDDIAEDAGRVEVISGLDFSTLRVLQGQSRKEFFGYSVSSAGRVDEDNVPDIMVGAPGFEGNRGRASVISGRTGTVLCDLIGATGISRFGYTVAPVGDVNKDGRDDIAVGSPSDLKDGRVVGSLQVYSLKDGVRRLWITHGGESSLLGQSTAGIGDANGDGIPDIAAGLPWNMHEAILFSGNDVARVGVSSRGDVTITSTAWSIGTPFTISGGSAPSLQAGFLFIALAPRLPIPVFPDFVVHVDPALLILQTAVFSDNAGTWKLALGVPGDPVLVGFTFSSQAAFPATNPLGYQLTPGCHTHVNGPEDRSPPVVKVELQVPVTTNQTSIVVPIRVTDASTTFTTVVANGQRVASSDLKYFAPSVPLIEGANRIEIRSTDGANNVADPLVVKGITRDTTGPELFNMVPAAKATLTSLTFPVSGESNEPLKYVWLNNKPVTLTSPTTFSRSYTAASPGNLTLYWIAEDLVSNQTTLKIPVTIEGVQTGPRIVSFPIRSASVDVDYEYPVMATHPTPSEPLTFSLPYKPDGSAIDSRTGRITWRPSETQTGNQGFTVKVTDTKNQSDEQPFVVYVSKLPKKPEEVAPDLRTTSTTSVSEANSFLYSGSNPIQTGAAPNAMELRRSGAVHGQVLQDDGSPLAGVTVSVNNHPEYGRTLSRADGHFDLAVNGGGLLTFGYDRDGFIPLQRSVDVPWLDEINLPAVVMIPYDSKVKEIDLGSQSIQIAEGSEVEDHDGKRRARLFFKPGTVATMMVGQDAVPLSRLSVRATEFTDGPNGAARMPGELPPESAYTYAVELSADEAVLADADTVVFSQPVPLYVENFLDFPVGSAVPAGYYDRNTGAWVPSDNGRVVKIHSFNGDLAELIIEENTTTPATREELAKLGIDDEERKKLKENYAVGTSLWRTPIPHFTPWDLNWGFGPPLEAIQPTNLEATSADELSPDDPCVSSGSIIQNESQTLLERIPVVGTPFTLTYSSSRLKDNLAARRLVIPITGSAIPASLDSVVLKIEIAGQRVSTTFSPATNLVHAYTWDGKDRYGRVVQGSRDAFIQIGYVYQAIYYSTPATYNRAFGRFSGVPMTGHPHSTREKVTLWQSYKKTLRSWDHRDAGIGGWSLDIQHAYDSGRNLLLGDGRRRSKAWGVQEVIHTLAGIDKQECGGNGPALETPLGNVASVTACADGSVIFVEDGCNRIRRVTPDGLVETVAGQGDRGFRGDGGPAIAALLKNPAGCAIGPDGSIYVADVYNHRIRCVRPGGLIETVAGDGTGAYAGDGGPAIDASLMYPFDVAVKPDGSLLIADSGNFRIRRVSPDGIIETMAGDGVARYQGDGGPAVQASIGNVNHIAVAADGSVYLSDNGRIRRIGLDGKINTIAGTGVRGHSGDGGSALQAKIDPRGLAVSERGHVVFAEVFSSSSVTSYRVREINSLGIIDTLAGDGTKAFHGDGGPSQSARFVDPVDVSFGPDGRLFVADYQNARIRVISHPLPGFTVEDVAIASRDGTQLYKFDKDGRHLETLGLLMNERIYRFRYTNEGRLSEVEDVHGNVTRVLRIPPGNPNAGTPTAIVSPYGQETKLTVNTEGYLASIENPAGETYTFTYKTGGYLTHATDPKKNPDHVYTYDEIGRLVRDDDPAGGFHVLDRTNTTKGYEVTRTTKLGRKTMYLVEEETVGDLKRVITYPCGAKGTALLEANGNESTKLADGTAIDVQMGPDPRFGMDAPLPERRDIVAPSNLKFTSTTRRAVTLATKNDPLSLLTMTTTVNVNGREYSSLFDKASSSLRYTSPEGRTGTMHIDLRGRITQWAIPKYESVNLTYDVRGRVNTVYSGTAQERREIVFHYDPLGNLTTITDPVGRNLVLAYDKAGRVTTQTLPGGSRVVYHYDANGNVTSIVPPGRPAHGFTYTVLDQIQEYRPPSLGPGTWNTAYKYDLDRKLQEIQRPDGKKVTFTYDNAGRLKTRVLPHATITYDYDPATSQLKTASLPGSVLTYFYDGSLTTAMAWSGTVAGTVTNTYDADMSVSSRSVNGGNTIQFHYDKDKLLTSAGSMKFGYDPENGALTATTLGNVTDALTYNSFGEPGSYSARYGASPIYSVTYTRDKLGRITARSETVGTSTTNYTYAYDLEGRLTTATIGSMVTVYHYDPNGNRTTVTRGATTIHPTHDAQDRLLTYGTLSFEYNNAGDLTKMTEGTKVTTYDYCALGQLLKVTLPDAKVIEYVIGGGGRRIGKKVNGTLVQGFLYKDSLNPVAELDGTGKLVSRFVYGRRPHVPDFMIKDGATYRILTDHLGSPRLVANVATGEVKQRIDYDEFGVVIADTNPGFQPFGFAGGLYDHETGLVRFGARDYFAGIGRWTAKDPISFFGGSANLYIYVNSEPVNKIDPLGLQTKLIFAILDKILRLGSTAQEIAVRGYLMDLLIGGALAGKDIVPKNICSLTIPGTNITVCDAIALWDFKAGIGGLNASAAILFASTGIATTALAYVVAGASGALIGSAINHFLDNTPGGNPVEKGFYKLIMSWRRTLKHE